MKDFLIYLLLIAFVSCNDRKDSVEHPKNSKISHSENKYTAFDEPNIQGIEKMKFYLLIVSGGIYDTLRIFSIRQDSNLVQAFYKRVPYEQVPPLFPGVVETKSFKFYTTRFSPTTGQVDSLKEIIRRNNLFALKDTIVTSANDGLIKEMIIYNEGEFSSLYRAYGLEKDIEPEFFNAYKEIMKFIPSEP